MRPIVLAAFILLTAPAQAQVYKWQDEWAVTHYSNVAPAKPPAGSPKLIEPARPPVYVPYSSLPYGSHGAPYRSAPAVAFVPYGAAPRTAMGQAAYERCASQRGVDCEINSYDPWAAVRIAARRAPPAQAR